LLFSCAGELDPKRDNLKVAREILELRVQQAQMHGYANYAEYATADTMAGKPARVMELLEVRALSLFCKFVCCILVAFALVPIKQRLVLYTDFTCAAQLVLYTVCFVRKLFFCC
jgi:hypothetical protein